ncbi:MAG: helix-turn-helix domain-containing protein [Lachnospiraceae bacterium]|nr:helix-turn-helix domain-containing protein [Lachnospiraceae bacterium]MDE6980275.1 helix-turn-helix domain-containing protein [Lachnospiraceae bacterium]
MNDRIKRVRKEANLTQKDFAKRLGIKQNTVASYEMGRIGISDAIITSICREFNINEEWLRYGKEPMNNLIEDKLSKYLGQIAKGNDDFIQDLIEVYMELDQTSKDTLKMLTNQLVDKRYKREQD